MYVCLFFHHQASGYVTGVFLISDDRDSDLWLNWLLLAWAVNSAGGNHFNFQFSGFCQRTEKHGGPQARVLSGFGRQQSREGIYHFLENTVMVVGRLLDLRKEYLIVGRMGKGVYK